MTTNIVKKRGRKPSNELSVSVVKSGKPQNRQIYFYLNSKVIDEAVREDKKVAVTFDKNSGVLTIRKPRPNDKHVYTVSSNRTLNVSSFLTNNGLNSLLGQKLKVKKIGSKSPALQAYVKKLI